MLSIQDARISVGVCETQPLLVEGLRTTLERSRVFGLIEPATSLDEACRMVVTYSPRIVLLDATFGTSAVLEAMSFIQARGTTRIVVWGSAMTEGDAVRFLKAGARGALRKTVDPSTLQACLEAVSNGG